MSTARHLQVGPYVSGMHLDLEGFQALAAVADDGRIDFDFHHSPGKAGEAVEQLISHMTQHEENKEQEDFAVGESPPILNIVIQVIGSPGDVQPFLVLGIELHNFGHRVRIATHPSFKTLVENVGLEFFSIGGDPQEMMVYMVKHPGLLPHFQKPDEGSAKEKRQAIREMLENLWKSCFITGNNFNTTKNISKTQQKPFVANAIIANPPSFAHIHCAEKLGVPLHMMFTMPWSPTRAFPHPLANIKTCSLNHSAANYFSFMLTDTLMWLGLRDLINSFRTETLDLEPIHILSAAAAVHKLKIPFTYCWPPSLIPKPVDWGPLISISGSYLLKPPVHYTPPQRLIEFLERFSSSIYIGFGSVVLENSDEVTRIVLNAIQKAGASAIINRGWANLGNNISKDLPNVLFIDDCPHGWIFKRISCVVHHGGAGTTAAVIAAGKPSVLIPCYGDQFFWAEIATMAGAGPPPILFRNLSADRLADAIRVALTPQVSGRAFELGMRVAKENEISNGVEAFHRQISGYKMHCSIFPRRAASWRIKETSISLSPFAAAVLMEENVIELESIELLRVCEYNSGYTTFEAIIEVVGIAIYSAVQLLQGLKELGAFLPDYQTENVPENAGTDSSRRKNFKRVMGGLSRIAFKVPISSVRKNETNITSVSSGFKVGAKGLCHGVYDGVSGIYKVPFRYVHDTNIVKAFPGIGAGMLSCVVKLTSGVAGTVMFPLQGLYTQLTEPESLDIPSPLELALAVVGHAEEFEADNQQRVSTLNAWRYLVQQDPILKKKFGKTLET